MSASAGFGCGTERWQVKTGTDRDARSVTNLPKPTSIAELTSIVAPAHPDARQNSRFPPTELTTFQVTGTLKVIKREVDDDYHVVIADPANPRMTRLSKPPDPIVHRAVISWTIPSLCGTCLTKDLERSLGWNRTCRLARADSLL